MPSTRSRSTKLGGGRDRGDRGVWSLAKGVACRFGKPISEEPRLALWFACFLLLCEAVLCSAIIYKVPYTKIDWDAYMQQVNLFLDGERDYLRIKGETGPLVYPAGHVYVFSALKFVTGESVFPAQIAFAVLYLCNLVVCFAIYITAGNVPVWGLAMLCLSKRYHSIFVLRLFNDCVAMFLCFLSVLLCQKKRLFWATVAMSLAVSVKMNALLMLPGLILLLVKGTNIYQQLHCLFDFVLIQVALAIPFLLHHSSSYFAKAFEFSRVFFHYWSVNFKFVPEEHFTCAAFAKALLGAHLSLLFAFAHWRWCRQGGDKGVFHIIKRWFVSTGLSILPWVGVRVDVSKDKQLDQTKALDARYVADVLFGCNFVGIVCARSLHYQFYCWYYPTLPFLLFSSRALPTVVKVSLWVAIEACFNVFPSTPLSSGLLMFCHVTLLAAYFCSALGTETTKGSGKGRKSE
jgi:alpha-1,3-mannosyltransferase